MDNKWKIENEEYIRKYWKDNNIFEKWFLNNKNSDKKFVFLEGPPYTNGLPHMGHFYVKSMKDLIAKYKNKKGYFTPVRAGYDMHGLPIEEKVEKKLGLKSKKEIEKTGVEKFIKECFGFAYGSMKEFNDFYDKIGRFVDYDNAYLPITNDYIESIWEALRRAYENKLLYEGYKPIWWCPRCQTTLSKQEVELGYIDAKYKPSIDESIFVKLRSKEDPNTYYIIWTTTPWTLLFNLGIMVNPELNYVLIKVKKTYINNLDVDQNNKKVNDIKIKSEDEYEYWIINKEAIGRLANKLNIQYEVIDEFKGSKLEGKEYIPPFYEDLKDILDGIKSKYPNAFKIWLSKEYVNNLDGSGLVHAAPGCGPEDYEVGSKYNVGPFNTTDEDGVIKNLGRFTGLIAREDNIKIVYELINKKLLLYFEYYQHDYPICWRCGSRAIVRTSSQWFISVESLKEKMIEDIKNVRFVPEFAKDAFRNNILTAPDWVISRQRYWGVPLPVWKCENGHVYIVRNSDELKQLTGKDLKRLYIIRVLRNEDYVDEIVNIYFKENKKYKLDNINNFEEIFNKYEDKSVIIVKNIDENKIEEISKKYYLVRTFGQKDYEILYVYNYNLHRPYVDEFTFKCPYCNKEMKRIPDVIDVWVDSGSATFATKTYPVDYIEEGLDQLRGWFYSLAVMGELYYSDIPYDNVYVNGFVLDSKGLKMSKSLGNVVDPIETIKNYGADSVRYFFATSAKAYEEVRFDFNELKARKQNLDILYNIGNYLIEYSKYYNINPFKVQPKDLKFEDKYMLHLLNKTIKKSEEELDNYNLYAVGRLFENLFLTLSRFYIKITRDRIKEDPETVLYIIGKVLLDILSMFSIIAPYVTEYIYLQLRKEFGLEKESILLVPWPKYNEQYINEELETIYEILNDLLNSGNALRNKLKINVRKPLLKLIIYPPAETRNFEILKNNLDSIKDIIVSSLNVKYIEIKEEANNNKENIEIGKYAIISYDLTTNKELENEWIYREIKRRLQDIRKDNGLRKGQKCRLFIRTDDKDILEILNNSKDILSKETDSEIILDNIMETNKKYEFEIEKKKIIVYFAL